MTDSKPLASLSLDLDNLWSYQKIHGDPAWHERPSYLPKLLPRALDLLSELELTITFFVVGTDAVREENMEALGRIAGRGHEVGNHSHEHEPWLHRYSRDQLQEEIERAHQAISTATGQHPTGFRGPGFSWSPQLLQVLADSGYRYDASTFPTFMGPLARTYYFWTSRLSAAERAERSYLFGRAREGLRPLKPYRWQGQDGLELVELPVTTMPFTRAPFHLSYLLYLSRWSESLALSYLSVALASCRVAGVSPSFLLHPLDLLGGDEVPELRFFPGMDLPTGRKLSFFSRVIGRLGRYWRLVPTGDHVAQATRSGRLKTVPLEA